MPILSINAPLSERIRYDFNTLTPEQIYDHVKALEDLLEAVNDSDLNTCIEVGDDPAEVKADIDKALNDAASSAVESCALNPYKDFFDDCVGALNSFWPAAEVTDEALKMAILDAIAKGDNDE